LFFQALDLPESERVAWVENRCQGDPSLFKEVGELLSNHISAGGFLQFESGPRCQTVGAGDVLAQRFQILRLIGAGGMGEVYEAEDMAGGLTVALKTISSEAAADTRLTARLKNELLLARNVSHPNVCKVYEYWETEHNQRRLVFFTMELLKGDTLAERIASRGRLGPREALTILRQIAAGIEAVHRLGIIHRDLKPSNVFLVPEPEGGERAVLMDFGLARTLSQTGKTETGLAMGTPPYMAPELFEGRDVTASVDIYSLGVMALEMVTGSNYPLIAPRSVVPELNSGWDQLLRCFNRDPARRPTTARGVVAVVERGSRPYRRMAIAAGAITACALAGLAAWNRLDRTPQRAAGVTQLTFDTGFTADPATSADGKLLVYASDRGSKGNLNIWLQRMDTGETRQLTNDSGDEDEPAISPDGSQIAYRSVKDKALFVQPAGGGSRRLLAKWGEAPRFSPDGSKIAYWSGVEGERTAPSGQIWLVPASGGAPRRLVADFADARSPAWSPDGRSILFRGARKAQPSLEAERDWWIVHPDGSGLTATGAGGKLSAAGLSQHDSPVVWNGSQVVFSARSGHTYNLWTLDLSSFLRRAIGSPTAITTSAGFQAVPALLPDGRIAYAIWREQVNVWQVSTSSGDIRQVTFHDSMDTRVSSSRKRNMLAFGRRLGEARDVWVKDLGSGAERPIARNELAVPFISPGGGIVALSIGSSIRLLDIGTGQQSALCAACGELLGWMPDEAAVIYRQDLPDGSQAISAFDRVSKTRRTLVAGRGLREAAVSPDGAMIAFTSRQNGIRSRIFVSRLNPSGPASSWVPMTPEDGWADKPIWSDDSHRIYFKSDRDGFECLWGQTLLPLPPRAVGAPVALRHFHQITFTLSHLPPTALGVSQAAGNVFVSVDADASNIWAVRP
jgi:serine/threonine protein kinase